MDKNINFEKDWRGIISSLLLTFWWSACIASIPRAIDIYTTSYDVDEKAGVLIYKHGLINKRQENIDIYRIKNVSSDENTLSGGHLYITNMDGFVRTLPYIKNANEVSTRIRRIVNKKRVDQGVKPIEMM